jgi:hypothetical protein
MALTSWTEIGKDVTAEKINPNRKDAKITKVTVLMVRSAG